MTMEKRQPSNRRRETHFDLPVALHQHHVPYSPRVALREHWSAQNCSDAGESGGGIVGLVIENQRYRLPPVELPGPVIHAVAFFPLMSSGETARAAVDSSQNHGIVSSGFGASRSRRTWCKSHAFFAGLIQRGAPLCRAYSLRSHAVPAVVILGRP